MFLTGVLSGPGLSSTDPQQEREPPPEPTPVVFPSHDEYHGQVWSSDNPPPNFQFVFSKVRSPTDISQLHVGALNVDIAPSCAISELIPLTPDGASYIPSLDPDEWTKEPPCRSNSEPETGAGRTQKDFRDRVAELRVENDLAFRIINRTVPAGEKPPRLAYMRKFWEGLESMAPYWDCSLDCYSETVDDTEHNENRAKRQRLNSSSSGLSDLNGEFLPEPDQILPTLGSQCKDKAQDPESTSTNQQDSRDDRDHNDHNTCDGKTGPVNASPNQHSRTRYKGRRTSTGRKMPDQFRAGTLRAFVEGTVWPFRAQVSPPRVMPVVQFNKLKLPVRQTAAVYSVPKDRLKGRQAWLEGPVLGLQARPETDFEDEKGQQVPDKARLDLLREIAALLQLGQERRREGMTDVKPGQGKWWTTKPRWGGGTGGDAENEIGNSDILQALEEALEDSQRQLDRVGKGANKNPKKNTPVMLWKELKCGKGFWDPRTEYTAIGKHPESKFDEVFLVSSLNHHISILKLTVHDSYIDYLTHGTLPQPLPADFEWSRPKLQRSQWFDLFDTEQRIEAFQGLWGVMAYLCRNVQAKAQTKPQNPLESHTTQK